jgi:hypothetical protein
MEIKLFNIQHLNEEEVFKKIVKFENEDEETIMKIITDNIEINLNHNIEIVYILEVINMPVNFIEFIENTTIQNDYVKNFIKKLLTFDENENDDHKKQARDNIKLLNEQGGFTKILELDKGLNYNDITNIMKNIICYKSKHKEFEYILEVIKIPNGFTCIQEDFITKLLFEPEIANGITQRVENIQTAIDNIKLLNENLLKKINEFETKNKKFIMDKIVSYKSETLNFKYILEVIKIPTKFAETQVINSHANNSPFIERISIIYFEHDIDTKQELEISINNKDAITQGINNIILLNQTLNTCQINEFNEEERNIIMGNMILYNLSQRFKYILEVIKIPTEFTELNKDFIRTILSGRFYLGEKSQSFQKEDELNNILLLNNNPNNFQQIRGIKNKDQKKIIMKYILDNRYNNNNFKHTLAVINIPVRFINAGKHDFIEKLLKLEDNKEESQKTITNIKLVNEATQVKNDLTEEQIKDISDLIYNNCINSQDEFKTGLNKILAKNQQENIAGQNNPVPAK